MVVLGTSYMLVHLEVLVVELVLVVQISERVVLQRYMGYLGGNSCRCLGVLGSCRWCWVFLG